MKYVKWFADGDVLDWLDRQVAEAKSQARANGHQPPSRSRVLNDKLEALMEANRDRSPVAPAAKGDFLRALGKMREGAAAVGNSVEWLEHLIDGG